MINMANSAVSRETFYNSLNNYLLKNSISFGLSESEKLLKYWQEILRWNKTHNLTTITELEQALDYHFLDSLLPVSEKKIFSSFSKVLDLGTGAGFPGIPLSILFPLIKFNLLDKNHKKISFLHYVTATLNISNAFPVQNSFFSHSEKYDAILSRAVKINDEIFSHCKNIINKGGWLIVYYSSNQEPYKSPNLSYSKEYHIKDFTRVISFYQF
ncbi:MAG TPA: 16S rRNA (guanine(527)-N(7))-methyltransferase RsmG [bacterium]|nr:16S rRNA (guanine(527)-N(7))-methyltransferase RsmG [bacterium]